jgi:hypothetical protein
MVLSNEEGQKREAIPAELRFMVSTEKWLIPWSRARVDDEI